MQIVCRIEKIRAQEETHNHRPMCVRHAVHIEVRMREHALKKKCKSKSHSLSFRTSCTTGRAACSRCSAQSTRHDHDVARPCRPPTPSPRVDAQDARQWTARAAIERTLLIWSAHSLACSSDDASFRRIAHELTLRGACVEDREKTTHDEYVRALMNNTLPYVPKTISTASHLHVLSCRNPGLA